MEILEPPYAKSIASSEKTKGTVLPRSCFAHLFLFADHDRAMLRSIKR